MKLIDLLYYYIILLLYLLKISICNKNSYSYSYAMKLKSHLEASFRMKQKSKTFINNLFKTVNLIDDQNDDNDEHKGRSFQKVFLEKSSHLLNLEPEHRYDKVFVEHFSTVPPKRIKNRKLTQYEFREYRNITTILNN